MSASPSERDSTGPMQAAPMDELDREAIRAMAQRWGWGEPQYESSLGDECEDTCTVGPFALLKQQGLQQVLSIGGMQEQPMIEWVLHEEHYESNYPHEPDTSDIVEFDTVSGSVWKALETLRMRELKHQVGNEIENESLGLIYRKDRELLEDFFHDDDTLSRSTGPSV